VIALASPAEVKGGLLWGAGPTVILPTTTREELTQGKYALGPAAVFLHMSKKWVFGIFPQYWWSIGRSGRREDVSQGNLQYFLWRSVGRGYQIGMSPNITYNHEATSGDKWLVPVGLGATKTRRFGKVPWKFQLEFQVYLIRPDHFASRYNVRVAITPVVPALIKRTLF
jgi:hypothetical protein